MALVSQASCTGAGPCHPRTLHFLEKSLSFSEKPLLARGLASSGLGPPLFPQLGSGVTVFGRQSLGLWLFPSFLVDGLFFSFHSFITFSVDLRREA